jgi:hypothetical protein
LPVGRRWVGQARAEDGGHVVQARPEAQAADASRHGPARAGPGYGGDLGHEVEVQELDELELDLARGRARLEEGGDEEEAVEGLEGARVLRGVDEGGDEDEEGGGLDGGAVYGFEEVQEELFVTKWLVISF